MSDQCMTEGRACVQAFEMSMRSTRKAWTDTALLSMVNSKRVEVLLEALDSGDGSTLADFLDDLGGRSFEMAAVRAGADAQKLRSLSRLLLRLLCQGSSPAGEDDQQARRSGALDSLRQRIIKWIEHGDASGLDARRQLDSIDELMGRSAQMRLSLLAPIGPALVVCGVVLRAHEAQYPFSRRV